jgi:hypothetical protein
MCIIKTGSLKFDPSRLLKDDRFAVARRHMRQKQTPTRELARQSGALLRYCLRRLPKAFASNQVNLEGFIELTHPYPQDVIDAVKARFEKAGFTVQYTFSDDTPTFDHLGFTPPADWIERLLGLSESGDKAMDEAAQWLVKR